MNVFVSGPLMFRDVVKAVTGKTFHVQCGLLNGYAQFLIGDEGQSALIPFPDRVVTGVVYLEVDDTSLLKLDAFQGRRFKRREVSIEAENGEWLEAEAYELNLNHKTLLTAKEWDEDEFRDKHLKKVVAACLK